MAKETKQRRALTQDTRGDPLEETFKSETKKAIASNYLKKNKGQGGGQVEGKSSPVLSKDKKIVEDLNRIKEMNSIMKLGQLNENSLTHGSLDRPGSAKLLGLQQLRSQL